MFPLPRNQGQELPHSDQKPLHLVVLLRFMSKLVLTNESGYYLDISLYKEVTEPASGQVRPPLDPL